MRAKINNLNIHQFVGLIDIFTWHYTLQTEKWGGFIRYDHGETILQLVEKHTME